MLNSRVSLVLCLIVLLVMGTDISYVYSLKWKERIEYFSCACNNQENALGFDLEIEKITTENLHFEEDILELQIVYNQQDWIIVGMEWSRDEHATPIHVNKIKNAYEEAFQQSQKVLDQINSLSFRMDKVGNCFEKQRLNLGELRDKWSRNHELLCQMLKVELDVLKQTGKHRF